MAEWLVRRDTGAPDLEWVAEIEVDADGAGELRHKGGLEGQVDRIRGAAELRGVLEGYRAQGCQVDEIPPS